MNDEELIKETMMLDYSQLVMHNVYMIKENKRLHSIIKEVREYIDRRDIDWGSDEHNHVLETLDKADKENKEC